MPADSTQALTTEALVQMPSAPSVGHNLVAGKPSADSALGTIAIHSPYDGTHLGDVPDSDARTVDEVVRAAERALPAWSPRSLKERTQPLFRFRELVLRHLPELANSAAREAGKTVAEARAGIEKGLEVVEYALSLQNLEQGASLEVSRGVRCELRREPLGVVAGITPFNFPAMVPMWLFPIAVTLGNAFILKPSEKVPLTALRLGELMCEAGYPPGVFSVVHGRATAVNALIDHPSVAAVGFVGSSRVAQQVYARAAERGKRALALGGAKNALILLPDAAPELAVSGIVASFTGCAGQRCMAGSLLIAVGPCDALIDAIVQSAARVRVGPDMGAIIDGAARQRLVDAIARAEAQGAQLRLDGRSVQPPRGYERGHWLGPTILDHVEPHSFSATEELFGPVLSIVRVPTLRDAIALEHESPYGNATSVFTQSGAHARSVADQSQSGMIGINIGVPVPREPFSFGGTKGSRFGHGDITGAGGVEFWTKLKKVTAKWGESSDGSWMS